MVVAHLNAIKYPLLGMILLGCGLISAAAWSTTPFLALIIMEIGVPLSIAYVASGILINDPNLECIGATGYPLRRVWLFRTGSLLAIGLVTTLGCGLVANIDSAILIFSLLLVAAWCSISAWIARITMHEHIGSAFLTIVVIFQVTTVREWFRLNPSYLFFPEEKWLKLHILRYLFLPLDLFPRLKILNPDLLRPRTMVFFAVVGVICFIWTWYLYGNDEALIAPRRE